MSFWPHLHPAVVHFPIALFSTSVGFDLACLLWRRRKWLDYAGVTLHVLALVGAGVAIITGRLAEGDLRIASPEVSALVGEHGEWAFFTSVAFMAVMLLRLESTWRDKKSLEIRAQRLRIMALVAAVGALWLLYETAGRGASLVYQYGVAAH